MRSKFYAAFVLIFLCASAQSAPLERFQGFNIVMTDGFPFGSPSAALSIEHARAAGANALAIVPFFWQPTPLSPLVARGRDMSDAQLRAAIIQVRATGLKAVVKPQVWIPQSWAGAIEPQTEADWQSWFRAYRDALLPVAQIAAEEGASSLVIGTELRKTSQRPEWDALIAETRTIFPGTLFYVAHNADEADGISFWPLLDAVGVSLYPPLGADTDRAMRKAAMDLEIARVIALARRFAKPIIVGEIGLRSARGAAEKPWESAEEREAVTDPELQAAVLSDWLSALYHPRIRGILIWRWFTNPEAGGPHDTDFTVQGKSAENVLRCAWSTACEVTRGRIFAR